MLQDVKTVLADEDQQFQKKVAKKIDILGDAPSLFQDTAMAAGVEMEEAIAGLAACCKTVKDEGTLTCIKEVRVSYRSQAGTAIFKHVQVMVKVKGEFLAFVESVGCAKDEAWATIDTGGALD